MDSNREVILDLLFSLGISLPKNTKLPNDALEKRFSQALDACQSFSTISTPVEPWKLSKWNPSGQSKLLRVAMYKRNVKEAAEDNVVDMIREEGGHVDESYLRKDTFSEVRKTLQEMSHCWEEQGHRIFVIMGADQQSAIIIKVIDVFVLADEVPLWTVLFKFVSKPPNNDLVGAVGDVLNLSDSNTKIPGVQTTAAERIFLSKLLLLNSARISPSYTPERRREEKSFGMSFLLPLAPLTMYDLGRLSTRVGCAICGKRESSHCKQCMSVSYCSKACQVHDWEQHKPMCLSLKNGTWRTVILTAQVVKLESKVMAGVAFNRFDSSNLRPDKNTFHISEDSGPPPDIHGDKTFLVKIQLSLSGRADNIFIYDRMQSFRLHMLETDNGQVYREMAHIIQTTGILRGKIYRWAKRVGDFKLSICLDKAPVQVPVW